MFYKFVGFYLLLGFITTKSIFWDLQVTTLDCKQSITKCTDASLYWNSSFIVVLRAIKVVPYMCWINIKKCHAALPNAEPKAKTVELPSYFTHITKLYSVSWQYQNGLILFDNLLSGEIETFLSLMSTYYISW